MQNKTNYQPRIERAITKMWVPHLDGEIAFAYPSVGPSNYRGVGDKILESNQQVPTGDYTASLLHAAYCSNLSNESEFKNVRDIMRKNFLWIYNQNLWTPQGVYVIKDDKAKGKSESLDVKSLEEILKGGKEIQGVRFSSDGKVRFAPKGSYGKEYMAPEKFAKDGFVIASCGLEGAEKMASVSSKFERKAYLYTLDVQEGQEQRVSAVGGDVGELGFDGGYWDDYFGGHAFGVWR